MNKDIVCAAIMLLNAVAIVFLSYLLANNPRVFMDRGPDIDPDNGLAIPDLWGSRFR
jgi:hypothetical protein